MIVPKSLKEGDTIGIIAPASPYRAKSKYTLVSELNDINKAIEKFGYKVKMGETCYLSYKGYLAGEDEVRV
ncbi:MAG: LD-carboxypeptidase, partial [Paraclostridium sp.]